MADNGCQMKRWKMTAVDFYKLLREIQDYRCFLSGRELQPENTSIVLKVPMHQGGIKQFDNICLVDSTLAALARRYSIAEIRSICLSIARYSATKKRLSPATVPRNKAAWHQALDRISNFNRSQQSKGRRQPKRRNSWGQCTTDELRRVNKTK